MLQQYITVGGCLFEIRIGKAFELIVIHCSRNFLAHLNHNNKLFFRLHPHYQRNMLKGSSINHVVKFLCIFDLPSWSLCLHKSYVTKWSFGQTLPLNCPRGLCMPPKATKTKRIVIGRPPMGNFLNKVLPKVNLSKIVLKWNAATSNFLRLHNKPKAIDTDGSVRDWQWQQFFCGKIVICATEVTRFLPFFTS